MDPVQVRHLAVVRVSNVEGKSRTSSTSILYVTAFGETNTSEVYTK